MAIDFVGSEKTTGISGSAPAISLHAGADAGDVAVLVVSADSDTNTITLPAGFTQVFNGDVPSAAVGATKLAVGVKVLGGSEPTPYTVTLGEDDGHAVSLSVWRGVDNTTPQDVAFSFAVLDSGVDPLPAAPSVNTITDGAAVITMVSDPRGPLSGSHNEEDYYQSPVGTIEVIDANTAAAGTNYTGHAVGWDILAVAGATGTRIWTSIDNNDGGFAGTLTLRPASATGNIEITLGDTQAVFAGNTGAVGNIAATLGDTEAAFTGDQLPASFAPARRPAIVATAKGTAVTVGGHPGARLA